MAKSRGLMGGDKLKSYMKDMQAQLQRNELEVGFLGDATYPDGTSVAHVASIQEYGDPSGGIPARPFFRNVISEEGPKWGGAMASLMRANGNDVNLSLRLLGERIQGQIQDSITTLREPGNAQSTIDKKGFDNPLIDTATMLRSVSYRVGGDE